MMYCFANTRLCSPSARGFESLVFKVTKKEEQPQKCDFSSFGAPEGTRWALPIVATQHPIVFAFGEGVRVPCLQGNKKEEQPRKRDSSSFGAPEGTRTPDLLVRSQTLYPTELPAHMERMTRLELATSTLARWRSTR